MIDMNFDAIKDNAKDSTEMTKLNETQKNREDISSTKFMYSLTHSITSELHTLHK
jgi:hypothetical protein